MSSKHLCPDCGSALRLRKGKTSDFWGCSAYPRCKKSFPDSSGVPFFGMPARDCHSCGHAGTLTQKLGIKGPYWKCRCGATANDVGGEPGELKAARRQSHSYSSTAFTGRHPSARKNPAPRTHHKRVKWSEDVRPAAATLKYPGLYGMPADNDD